MAINTNKNTDIPKDVVSLSDFFPAVTYTPDACEITVNGKKITLTMSQAKEAAAILKKMTPALKNFKGTNRYADNAKRYTEQSALSLGQGLVAMSKVNERLAAEMLHRSIGSSVNALIPKG